jgi:hypothetical protein
MTGWHVAAFAHGTKTPAIGGKQASRALGRFLARLRSWTRSETAAAISGRLGGSDLSESGRLRLTEGNSE